MNHFISSVISFMTPYIKSGLGYIVGIVIIGYFGFLIGDAFVNRENEQDTFNSEQFKQDLQKEEEEFGLILEETCSRTATESDVLDLYKCKTLKEDEQYLAFFNLEEIEEEVNIRKNIIPCNKSISESKLFEIVDCLNFGDSELE